MLGPMLSQETSSHMGAQVHRGQEPRPAATLSGRSEKDVVKRQQLAPRLKNRPWHWLTIILINTAIRDIFK